MGDRPRRNLCLAPRSRAGWSLSSCLPLQTEEPAVSRKGNVAMGTHVQLFYSQKITDQPTWLEHVPSTEQRRPPRFSPLSEEVEKKQALGAGHERGVFRPESPFTSCRRAPPCRPVDGQAGAARRGSGRQGGKGLGRQPAPWSTRSAPGSARQGAGRDASHTRCGLDGALGVQGGGAQVNDDK